MTSFYHGVYFTRVNMLIIEPTLHNWNRILLILDVFSKNMFDNFKHIYFPTFKIEQFFSFAVFQTFWYLITIHDQMFLAFLLALSFYMPYKNIFFPSFKNTHNDSVKNFNSSGYYHLLVWSLIGESSNCRSLLIW